jgi:CBS domain containing-hemolysin-like protein
MSVFSGVKKWIGSYLSKKNEGSHGEPALHPIQSFLELTVDEAMIPRSDVMAISAQTPFDEVVKKFLKTGFRWLPVFRESLDDIAGIVSVHCVLSLKESDDRETEWLRHLNKAFFGPTSMTIEDALRHMYHHHKTDIIFVVDEHGGIEGMLTKGHLLREACAWCMEDFSEEEMVISKDPWVISGRMDLETFAEEIGADNLFNQVDLDRVNTIGGWLCAYVERVPLTGEVISHPSGYTFEIRQATPRNIHQIAILEVPSQVQSA